MYSRVFILIVFTAFAFFVIPQQHSYAQGDMLRGLMGAVTEKIEDELNTNKVPVKKQGGAKKRGLPNQSAGEPAQNTQKSSPSSDASNIPDEVYGVHWKEWPAKYCTKIPCPNACDTPYTYKKSPLYGKRPEWKKELQRTWRDCKIEIQEFAAPVSGFADIPDKLHSISWNQWPGEKCRSIPCDDPCSAIKHYRIEIEGARFPYRQKEWQKEVMRTWDDCKATIAIAAVPNPDIPDELYGLHWEKWPAMACARFPCGSGRDYDQKYPCSAAKEFNRSPNSFNYAKSGYLKRKKILAETWPACQELIKQTVDDANRIKNISEQANEMRATEIQRLAKNGTSLSDTPLDLAITFAIRGNGDLIKGRIYRASPTGYTISQVMRRELVFTNGDLPPIVMKKPRDKTYFKGQHLFIVNEWMEYEGDTSYTTILGAEEQALIFKPFRNKKFRDASALENQTN